MNEKKIKNKKQMPELESGMFGKLNTGTSFVVVKDEICDGELILVFDDGTCDPAFAFTTEEDDGCYITELWVLFAPCFKALDDKFGLCIFKRT